MQKKDNDSVQTGIQPITGTSNYRLINCCTSWPTEKKEKSLSAETVNGLAGKSVPFLRNIKLFSTDHGRIRYVSFSNLFSKNLSFWRRGCSDYICLYSNQTPLPLFSLYLCPTLLKARVIVVGVGCTEQASAYR